MAAIIPSEPQTSLRCLAGDCGWYVTGPVADALADYERHAAAMHGGKPLDRFGPSTETRSEHLWKAANESLQVQRDRLIEEHNRDAAVIVELDSKLRAANTKIAELAAELERVQAEVLEFLQVQKPTTAITVVHPNDEINAVLDLLERYPHMGDFRVLAVKGESLKVERAARRWRDAVKEQAG